MDKNDILEVCILYSEADVTIAHTVSECVMLAQKASKYWRFDKVFSVSHEKPCQKIGFKFADKWYNFPSEWIFYDDKEAILCHLMIQRDKSLDREGQKIEKSPYWKYEI